MLQSTIRTKKLWQVFAPQRSGHHAILAWLIGMIPNKLYWFDHFYWKDCKFDHIKVIENGNFPIKEKIYKLPNDQVGNVLVSCENFDLDFYCQFKFPYTKFTNMINILILRDIKNCVASRIKRGIKTDDQFYKFYERYYDEALGFSNDIPNKQVILFDNWFTDINYRENIAKNLNLKWQGDKNKDFLIRDSSFEGRACEKEASQMKVLGRYVYLDKLDIPSSLIKKNKLIFG